SVDHAVLIEGETGTGKELVAEEIHRASRRGEAPFVVLEASELPHRELMAQLFGAGDQVGQGLLAKARGGVLFIDEIGDLSRLAQRSLREALAKDADVRLIAATRRDLDRDVATDRFDEELYFGLVAGRIELPPLRERRSDVIVLARAF